MTSEIHQPASEAAKDEHSIREVINKVKSQGLFDQFRKECIADVDTKPAYQNLVQRVESYVEHFLQAQKWSMTVNKNQLRETLRRQLHNSGMMNNGVDRIIEQVVNPKILLGIKPKVDEAVCDHLGIDLKARQEDQHRRKQEQQHQLLQQQLQQQQQLQSVMNHNVKPGEPFNSGAVPPPFSSVPWAPGMPNFPNSAVPGVNNPVLGVPNNAQGMGNFPRMTPPFSSMGGWAPGLPGMPGMTPGQPMIPACNGAILPPPPIPGVNPFNPAISSVASSVVSSPSTFSTPPRPVQTTKSPVIPDLSKPPPNLPAGPIRPPPPGSVPPPPGTVPIVPPSPATTLAPPAPPAGPTASSIPALISHTLSKVSADELTPEKIAVFKTAAAFITKTVNNAQGTPGADLASMFSPRVLAEAMMEESGKPLSKQEIRAVKRKERMKEYEKLKAERDREERSKRFQVRFEDKEDPLPPTHNLMDVFEAAEDVSDDEDMLDDIEEPEDKNKQGIVLSEEESDKDEQPPTSQPGKRYNFAWDVDINPQQLSDVTVSSIHTSDISSFEDGSSEGELVGETAVESIQLSVENAEDQEENNSKDLEQKAETTAMSEAKENVVQDNEDNTEMETTTDADNMKGYLADEDCKEPKTVNESQFSDDVVPLIPPLHSNTSSSLKPSHVPVPSKPRKLLALSYNYSDSDDEETREERKARIAREKEERYLKRQQRRAELEARKKEREEEKARTREEKKKQQALAESSELENVAETSTGLTDLTNAENQAPLNTSVESCESPSKSTPKKRKNKAELKEQLHQQKVLERKAALRHRRTRNRRYASEEFTSFFSERKTLNQSYTDAPLNTEDIVTFDGTVEVMEMTIDQECVVETIGETVETSTVAEDVDRCDLVLQCPSPYSDISDRSMSDKSDLDLTDKEDSTMKETEMDTVSSDEEINSGLEEQDYLQTDERASTEHQIDDESQGSVSEAFSPKAHSLSRIKSIGSLEGGESAEDSMGSFGEGKNANGKHVYNTNQGSSATTGALESEARSTYGEVKSHENSKDLLKARMQEEKTLYGSEAGKDQAISTAKEVEEKAVSPKNIMGNLELEPVSDEDSSLDGLSDAENKDGSMKDKEEGEDIDSDDAATKSLAFKVGEMIGAAEDVDVKKEIEEDDASDEGEIKSDSEDEKLQQIKKVEEKERMANRKPIELVDFGEAEKRVRESRSYYNESERRRSTTTSSSSNYRGQYSWQTGSYSGSNNARYGLHDPSSPVRAKSPVESEASSHSRSSTRVRDDAPPSYPIQGSSRRHRSPASEHSSLSKPVSPPSPMLSSPATSKARSRSRSRSRSVSRSRSNSSSRSSSSSSSSGSRGSAWKRRHLKKLKHSKDSHRKIKDHPPQIPVRPQPPRMAAMENYPSPLKSGEELSALGTGSAPAVRERLLSSGHESISSDELPDFPEEEVEQQASPSPRKKRFRSASGSSTDGLSSLKRKKRKQRDSSSKGSISSSELLYSPTRNQLLSQEESASLQAKNRKLSDRSTDRSSISSGELPDSPGRGSPVGFSPHRPSSPSSHPPLPDDMSGFQPPLPQEPHGLPPLPYDEQPPLPPLPPEEHVSCPPEPSCFPPLPSSPPTEDLSPPYSPHYSPHTPSIESPVPSPVSAHGDDEVSRSSIRTPPPAKHLEDSPVPPSPQFASSPPSPCSPPPVESEHSSSPTRSKLQYSPSAQAEPDSPNCENVFKKQTSDSCVQDNAGEVILNDREPDGSSEKVSVDVNSPSNESADTPTPQSASVDTARHTDQTAPDSHQEIVQASVEVSTSDGLKDRSGDENVEMETKFEAKSQETRLSEEVSNSASVEKSLCETNKPESFISKESSENVVQQSPSAGMEDSPCPSKVDQMASEDNRTEPTLYSDKSVEKSDSGPGDISDRHVTSLPKDSASACVDDDESSRLLMDADSPQSNNGLQIAEDDAPEKSNQSATGKEDAEKDCGLESESGGRKRSSEEIDAEEEDETCSAKRQKVEETLRGEEESGVQEKVGDDQTEEQT